MHMHIYMWTLLRCECKQSFPHPSSLGTRNGHLFQHPLRTRGVRTPLLPGPSHDHDRQVSARDVLCRRKLLLSPVSLGTRKKNTKCLRRKRIPSRICLEYHLFVFMHLHVLHCSVEYVVQNCKIPIIFYISTSKPFFACPNP